MTITSSGECPKAPFQKSSEVVRLGIKAAGVFRGTCAAGEPEVSAGALDTRDQSFGVSVDLLARRLLGWVAWLGIIVEGDGELAHHASERCLAMLCSIRTAVSSWPPHSVTHNMAILVTKASRTTSGRHPSPRSQEARHASKYSLTVLYITSPPVLALADCAWPGPSALAQDTGRHRLRGWSSRATAFG